MKRTSFARRLLTLAATALLAACLVPSVAQAADIVDSGKCGYDHKSDATWTLYSDGELVIAGKGDVRGGLLPWTYSVPVKTVRIGDGITSTGFDSFHDCKQLNSVSLPESLEYIGQNAFGSCSSLQSIALPEGLRHIDQYAFEHCTSLESIYFPEGLINIGDEAFAGCSSLGYVYIPSSVGEIGLQAFDGIAEDAVVEAGSWSVRKMLKEDCMLPAGARVVVDIAKCDVALEYAAIVYDGQEKTPAVTVKSGGSTVPAKNYTVSYADNVEAGTATVTVTPTETGALAGDPVTATFQIIGEDELNFKVSKKVAAVNYNGTITKAAYPITLVKYNWGPLEYAKVSGSEYLTVTKTGKTAGKYTGKVTVAPKTPVGKYQMVMRITDTGTGFYKDVTVTIEVKRFAPTISIAKKMPVLTLGGNTGYCYPITQVVCVSKPMTYQLVRAYNASTGKDSTRFKVGKTSGKVTVSKYTKPGKYKLQVKVLSSETPNYKQNWKIVTCTIVVK